LQNAPSFVWVACYSSSVCAGNNLSVERSGTVASDLTLYALKPVFVGSLQDYLTLFVWGASIDQERISCSRSGLTRPPASKRLARRRMVLAIV
jgi:hypothetical protein